jgi:uncharacterized tellurite resistance protein B-like protein
MGKVIVQEGIVGMGDFIGLTNEDSLAVGGHQLGEEAAELSGQAQALFNSMEDDARAAMTGNALGVFLSAHEELNKEFGVMMRWLDIQGVNLKDANSEILQADMDNASAFDEAASGVPPMPRINV